MYSVSTNIILQARSAHRPLLCSREEFAHSSCVSIAMQLPRKACACTGGQTLGQSSISMHVCCEQAGDHQVLTACKSVCWRGCRMCIEQVQPPPRGHTRLSLLFCVLTQRPIASLSSPSCQACISCKSFECIFLNGTLCHLNSSCSISLLTHIHRQHQETHLDHVSAGC